MRRTVTFRWFFPYLLCFLVGGLVDSSSLSSADLRSISTNVGKQAVLPCSWKPRLGEVNPSSCHVQWTNPVDTVFEQQGARKWEAEEFQGRLEVSEDKLGSGDCSLTIRDVQIGDTGSYDSFMVVDGIRSKRTRVFIQRVRLLVSDHKSLQSRVTGEDLVLELYTRHSVRVIFMGRNSSEWSDLWMRGDTKNQRLEKHLLEEQLTIKNLKSSDEGQYKVLDEQGLAISTVNLQVEGGSKSFHVHLERTDPTGAAASSSCSALLIISLLLMSFRIPHL